MIPYASRTVDIILHPDCPLPKKGAKDVINLLKTRDLSCVVEAVVQLSPERYRLTFHHARQMHAFSNQDFLVHGKPVEFKSVSPFTWVYISRLSYGIPDEAITRALAPYSGGIKTMKSVVHENIYTGEHNVLMKITANIPARLRIAGHWCVVKYSGQKQLCFKCHKEGHVIADCPTYQNNFNNNSATTSSNTNTNNADSSAPVAPPRPLVSYAAAAASNPFNLPPSESANGSSTPLANTNNQSAPDCASGAPASSAPSTPSGGGGTVVNEERPSTVPFSPVRRRGKRRHSPIQSPQPEGKRATHAETDELADDDDTASLGCDSMDRECTWSGIPVEQSTGELAALTPMASEDAESRPEETPLPHDDDDELEDDGDDEDDDEDNETDMDNDINRNTDEDGDNETGIGQSTPTINNGDDDDDDVQGSEEDPTDPTNRLDFDEDNYSSDDNASFATVSEAEMPNSPAPRQMPVSLKKKNTHPHKVVRNEPASAVAHSADSLFKLAAVLPTQGGSSPQ